MNPQEIIKLENKVTKTLTSHLKKTDIIIAGISGGPDSIFLLQFLSKLPNKTVVAHLNHGLRKDSGKDELFTKKLAKSLSLQFHSKKADISSLAKKSKKGIEETGRIARYKFFNHLKTKYKAAFIATAHHADDNLETIILNLTRGATLKGLTGMQILSPPLFRPLLGISKDQILAYLKFKKIKFRTDKSNFSNKYTRNTIRNKIIPELKALNPSITETIAKNTKNLREIQDFIEKEAEKYLQHQIPAKKFKSLHPALQKTILLKLHEKNTGSNKNIENTHLDEVLKILNQNIGGKRKTLGSLTFSVRKNTIKVEKS
ncbi:MAG: tRNA lysidine(34) synthetase TilS [Candidatus Peregrinibacteria bacterium]